MNKFTDTKDAENLKQCCGHKINHVWVDGKTAVEIAEALDVRLGPVCSYIEVYLLERQV